MIYYIYIIHMIQGLNLHAKYIKGVRNRVAHIEHEEKKVDLPFPRFVVPVEAVIPSKLLGSILGKCCTLKPHNTIRKLFTMYLIACTCCTSAQSESIPHSGCHRTLPATSSHLFASFRSSHLSELRIALAVSGHGENLREDASKQRFKQRFIQ